MAKNVRIVGQILLALVLAGETWAQPPYDLRPVAEFEQHDGMIIGWYQLGCYGAQPDTMWAEAVAAIRQVATAYIAVQNSSAVTPIQDFLTSLGIPLTNIQFLVGNMFSVWVRDYGPEFCYNEFGHRVIVEGGYSQQWPQALAALWGLEHYHVPLSLQGGNYMADGARQVAVSSAPVSNPELWQETVRQYFDLPLHVVPKLQGEPCGHIDMYARFVAPDRVVIAQYMDPYYNANMQAAAAQFEGMGYEVYRITTPTPSREALPALLREDPSLVHLPPGVELPRDGMRYVYRTYTNGIQCNGLYLMPTYDHRLDQQALALFQQALPDHQIIPIRCVSIINAGGALHCTSSDVPPEALPRPATLTIVPTGDDLQVSWSPVLGAFSYQLYRLAEPVGYAEGLDDYEAVVGGTSWLSADPFASTHHAVYEVLAVSGGGVMSAFTDRCGAFRFPADTGSD